MVNEVTDFAWYSSDIFINNNKFVTIYVSVKEFHVIWDNPHNILHVNTPNNHANFLSLIMVIVMCIKGDTLSAIQFLY